ncbi:hypothetical protein GOV11_02860 [Candidatus Woesearchaeota archaeon]|nr:hypothetical protein [Candidatus Woesearchaeota archaeon]
MAQHPSPKMEGILDPAYLNRLEKRTESLARSTLMTREQIKRTDDLKTRGQEDLQTEMQDLHIELAKVKVELTVAIGRIGQIVRMFQNVAVKSDVQHIQARIDAWAPETRISRREFLKMLQD